MGKDHRGQSSGTNKSEDSGVPQEKYTENMERDQELTDRYTDGKGNVADGVPQQNPNRNVDKGDATNAGGYRN